MRLRARVDAPLEDIARTLESSRAISARAALLVVGQLPPFPAYAGGFTSYGTVDFSPEGQEACAALGPAIAAKVGALETLLQQHDVSGSAAAILCEP